MGLKDAEVIALRRAALLHNLGRLAVGNGILDKAGPLNPPEWERMLLYPYHTERVLVRPAAPNRQALSRNGGYSSVTRITA